MELEELETNEKKESGKVENVTPKIIETALENDPAEKEIKLQVVVETLRLVVHGFFFGLIILGIILTWSWGGIPRDNMLTKVFGNMQICLYVDFRPVPYVVPPLYAIVLTFMILYAAASCFRAWIVFAENKISFWEQRICQGCYLYLAFCGILFSISFAVQPLDHESMIMHTLPFTWFCSSLLMNQMAVNWFGTKVAWRTCPQEHDSPFWVPNLFRWVSHTSTAIQLLATLFKILIQLNGVTDWSGHGLVFHPNQSPGFVWFTSIVDWTWFVTGFFFPMIQSGYLVYHKGQTHDLIIKVSDNREPGKIEDTQISEA